MEKRVKRIYTEDFKLQMVKLHASGKKKSELIKEYELTPSALNKWISQYQETGSFKAKDNRTAQENELIELKKENAKLKMEIDILKQAALIMGRK